VVMNGDFENFRFPVIINPKLLTLSRNKMAKIRIAINGFGRIGRAAFKVAEKHPKLEVVGINDTSNTEVLAYLLKYDSVYGRYGKEVSFDENNLIVNKTKIPTSSEMDPALLKWTNLKVDVVLECTGRFTNQGLASGHIKAGAKKVIVSAPTNGGDMETFLLGVNSKDYKNEKIISNASCTTNCIAPVASVLQENFGIAKGMMTTVHAYTAEQRLVDSGPPSLKSDFRRGRAAGVNIVPTSTGAAVSTTEVIKGIQGKFDGIALRVPVAVGSLSDFTVVLKKKTTAEEVNKIFESAVKKAKYKNILGVTRDPFVSSDIIGDPRSAVVDLTLTKVVDGDLLKILAWYDNEWGYANRLVEEAEMIG